MDAVKPQRPIFGFLWRTSAPIPQDGAAVQPTWKRIPARGPWRLILLITLTALLITGGAAMISVVLTAPTWAGLLVSVAVLVPLTVFLIRAWVVGTSVSDTGIKVSRLLTTVVIPWSDVTAIDTHDFSRWLGLPVMVRATGIVATTTAGSVPTHVTSVSADLWLRPQSFDAAADGLRTWWRETH